jgi:hypothetical protein
MTPTIGIVDTANRTIEVISGEAFHAADRPRYIAIPKHPIATASKLEMIIANII